MSATGMKTNKKRKIDEISNTKPAVAKSLKAKLAQAQLIEVHKTATKNVVNDDGKKVN